MSFQQKLNKNLLKLHISVRGSSDKTSNNNTILLSSAEVRRGARARRVCLRVANQDCALRFKLRKRERRKVAHGLPVRILRSSKSGSRPVILHSVEPNTSSQKARTPGTSPEQAVQPWLRRWAQQTCKGGMARMNSVHATSSAAAIDTPSRTLRRASRHSRRLALMSVRQAMPVAAMWITPAVVEGCMGAVLGQQARWISARLCGHVVDGMVIVPSALLKLAVPHETLLMPQIRGVPAGQGQCTWGPEPLHENARDPSGEKVASRRAGEDDTFCSGHTHRKRVYSSARSWALRWALHNQAQ